MDTRKEINQPRRDQGIKMLERMVAFQKLFELGEDALFSQGEEAGWSRSLSYSEEFSRFIAYSGAAEPQFRGVVSHPSGTTEPPFRFKSH